MGKITISNGHFNFFLGELGQNLAREELLDVFIAAGYPSGVASNFLSKCFDSNESVRRLLNRRKSISNELICSLWMTEFLVQLAQKTRGRQKLGKLTEFLDALSLKVYAISALRLIRRSHSEIYHFRSGYGLWSASEAKRRGMITVCDHSIAHPATVDYLVNNVGQLPKAQEKIAVSKFWSLVQRDVDISDYVIVNSDFVRETFLNRGYDPSRIIVIYSGIDDDSIPLVRKLALDSVPPSNQKQVRFLFCGKFEKRKGSRVLLDAIARYPDSEIHLEIVGVANEQIDSLKNDFQEYPNLKVDGFLSRKDMLKKMIDADVFLYPSLCEGSARVVFLAMLCKCYIITTPNSGSVVVDKVHGAIIPPGNSVALSDKMREIANSPRDYISRIGDSNHEVISSEYNESAYFEAIKAAYSQMLFEEDRVIPGLNSSKVPR